MKKRFFVLMLLVGALSMTLTSCNEDILPDNGEGNEGKGVRTVKLGVQIESGTKVTLSNDATPVFAWEVYDKIGVWVGTSSSDAGGGFQEFTVSEEGEKKLISGNIPDGKNRFNYAVFPSGIFSYSGGSLTVTLPHTYALSEVRGTKTPLPMVAVNDKEVNSLTFYNVGGMLRLTVNGIPADATYLQVDFGGKQVCGDFTITSPNPGNSTISTSTISDSSPANAGDNIRITNLGDATSAVINIPLPIGEYASISVSAWGSSNVKIKDMEFNYTARRATGKALTAELVELPSSSISVKQGSIITPSSNELQSIVKFRFKKGPSYINNIRFIRVFSQNNKLQDTYVQGTNKDTKGPVTVSQDTDLPDDLYVGLRFTPTANDPIIFQVIDANGMVYSGSINAPSEGYAVGKIYEETVPVKLYTFTVAGDKKVCFSPGDLGQNGDVYSFTVPFENWGGYPTQTLYSMPNPRSWFNYDEVDSDTDPATSLYGIRWRIETLVSSAYEWDYIISTRQMNDGVSRYYKVTVNGNSNCLLLPPDEAISDDIGSDLTSGVGADYVKYLGKGFVLLMNAKQGTFSNKKVSWSSTYYGYWMVYNNGNNRKYLKWSASDTPAVNVAANQFKLHVRLVHNVD